MQEELIERLVEVEKKALQLEEEGKKEAEGLKKKYQERMAREERVKLKKADEKGQQMLAEAENEAQNYVERIEKELNKKLEQMEKEYHKINNQLIEKYFNEIINLKGV